MDWGSLLLGGLMSALVGIALWAFLPRGVVLTRATRTKDWRGEPLHDRWELKNASSIPIQLLSVRMRSAATWDESLGRFEERELGPQGLHSVTLTFDDFSSSVRREDGRLAWNEVIVSPGETLEAHVPVNAALLIDYRRAGPLGVFERRHVAVHGYA